jgi:hypothetical protein
VEECKRKCQFYQEHGKQFRTKHLNERMRLAEGRGDEKAMEKIATIIQQKKQCSFWRRLNYVTGKKSTQSATSTQVPTPSGLVTELSTQEPVEDAIFSKVHGTRYTLAKEAPVCSAKLFHDFGYLTNTPAPKAVLDETYFPPPNTDTATKELFNKIATIRKKIPKDFVSYVITPAHWKRYWAIVNKETSLSESGLHFGHYKVGCRSNIIAHYHAAWVTVILAHAIQLERWPRELSVMLKKMLGVTLVTKLRAILLMEVDFNASNKIIYGARMMEQAHEYNLMLDEIYSKKIGWRTMGLLQKHISLTLHDRPEHQQPSLQSMHLIAMTGLLTRLLHWSFKHLAYQNWQLGPC